MLTPRLRELAIRFKQLNDLDDDLDKYHRQTEAVLQMLIIQCEDEIMAEGGEIDDDLNVVMKEWS